MFLTLVISLLKIISVILPVLISVAFMTLFERKIMATMQRRRGPNVVGVLGLLQPFADALKLLTKEIILPYSSNFLIFLVCPAFSLLIAVLLWIFVPFDFGLVLFDTNLGVLYVLFLSSLTVYSTVMSGWASNSKYSFLGALRSVAQMISYEVSISIIILAVVLLAGSFNFSDIIIAQRKNSFLIPLFPLFVMFFVSALAETNRPPFDLPEAENELVAGYFVEYSGAGFALFFIAETLNIIFMSFLCVIYFCGGWYVTFCVCVGSTFFLATKVIFFCFLFVWVRASLPRYRYDQLMFLGWKVFLPISTSILVFLIGFDKFLNGLFIF